MGLACRNVQWMPGVMVASSRMKWMSMDEHWDVEGTPSMFFSLAFLLFSDLPFCLSFTVLCYGFLFSCLCLVMLR